MEFLLSWLCCLDFKSLQVIYQGRECYTLIAVVYWLKNIIYNDMQKINLYTTGSQNRASLIHEGV